MPALYFVFSNCSHVLPVEDLLSVKDTLSPQIEFDHCQYFKVLKNFEFLSGVAAAKSRLSFFFACFFSLYIKVISNMTFICMMRSYIRDSFEFLVLFSPLSYEEGR